ncbi:MAG: hypothetical protein M3Z07_04275 [Candidatus Eremiobacteraeota bacterium]|nr:hypothetical protein [Candidatus Eremiobacteraeota bacterium]
MTLHRIRHIGFLIALLAALLTVLPFSASASNPAPAAKRPNAKHRALTPTIAPSPLPSAERVLGLIRRTFRSHRPPPAYETYTLERRQLAENGYQDFVESYTYHIWCRTVDRACLGRKVFNDDYFGSLEFLRPAFNEARDPGPPTADVFEPAPIRSRPVEFVPTPEPTNAPLIIGSVRALGEFEYKVKAMAVEGELVHLSLTPVRDPDRNRLREIYADKTSYELVKIIATDKLFVDRGPVYPVTFTYTMSSIRGTPVVTDLHGIVGGGYTGDGVDVDYHFKDIAFPRSLPSWYFDARTYAAHKDDAPQ